MRLNFNTAFHTVLLSATTSGSTLSSTEYGRSGDYLTFLTILIVQNLKQAY